MRRNVRIRYGLPPPTASLGDNRLRPAGVPAVNTPILTKDGGKPGGKPVKKQPPVQDPKDPEALKTAREGLMECTFDTIRVCIPPKSNPSFLSFLGPCTSSGKARCCKISLHKLTCKKKKGRANADQKPVTGEIVDAAVRICVHDEGWLYKLSQSSIQLVWRHMRGVLHAPLPNSSAKLDLRQRRAADEAMIYPMPGSSGQGSTTQMGFR